MRGGVTDEITAREDEFALVVDIAVHLEDPLGERLLLFEREHLDLLLG